MHRILEECLEETQAKSHTTRTDALSCMISSGITETAGLLLGEERQHGRRRILTVVDFVSGEENGGLALRAKHNVALTYELMQMCVSEYIPQKFPSRSVEIVGWYHSHPREITLDDMSSVDKETQKAYQALYESAVCLIVKIELLSRAWLKALTHSYVLMDEIRKALCFYQISGRNKVVPIEWGFQRDGVNLSLQTHVYPSWFTPLKR